MPTLLMPRPRRAEMAPAMAWSFSPVSDDQLAGSMSSHHVTAGLTPWDWAYW